MTRLAIHKYHYSTEERTCGGSLIDSHWILTAAHCIYREYNPTEKIPFHSISAIIGGHNWKDGFRFMLQLEDTHVHPKYHWDKQINDIALIQIPDQIQSFLQVPAKDLIQINAEPSLPFGE